MPSIVLFIRRRVDYRVFEADHFDSVEYVRESLQQADLSTHLSRLHFGIENIKTEIKQKVLFCSNSLS